MHWYGLMAWVALGALVMGQANPAHAQTPAHTAALVGKDPLAVLAGVPRSGAVSQQPGEVYRGPGPLTVGYLGAKKQIVLPQGTWVLLAAEPRTSLHATPVAMTSMVFGRVVGERIDAVMQYLFNDRTPPLNTKWNDVDECLTKPPPGRAPKVEWRDASWRGCGWIVRTPQPGEVKDAGWERAQSSAVALGLAWPNAGGTTLMRGWAGDATQEYLAFRRMDFDANSDAAIARRPWLEAFMPIFVEGMHRKLNADELEAGKTPRTVLNLPE